MTKDTEMKLQALSDSAVDPPTFVNISLDLQIIICTLLHPSDILALRETCKTLQLPTRQRVVWIAALRRVCLENSLFLPSFPILDMSDVELEHAAMAPRRWIDLCAAVEKQHPNNSGATLRPRTTRIIDVSAGRYRPEPFIVPGGRYMVGYSPSGICIWDLGYTSNTDCKLIALVGLEGGSYNCMVQATPDGMGLIILSSNPYEHCQCSIYEIYPQSETPQLIRIARLGLHLDMEFQPILLPDRVLWYRSNRDCIIFRVWDYRVNHSIGFSGDIDLDKVDYYFKIIATRTAITVVCFKEILVWAIPPLSPQPLDFFDHSPTHIPPLFRIAYPDGIARCHAEFLSLQTMSHWYGGSSQPLYFDILCRNSKLHRFEIIVKPDLCDTSLHLTNTERIPHDFENVTFQRYSICEDTLVSCWESDDPGQSGAYTGLTSSRFTAVISPSGSAAKMLLPPTGYNFYLCPTSGRYVHFYDEVMYVVDLF